MKKILLIIAAVLVLFTVAACVADTRGEEI